MNSIKLCLFLFLILSVIHLKADSLPDGDPNQINKIIYPDHVILAKGDYQFPPFEFINENNEPDGFNVDLFKAVMKELGFRYEISLGNWAEIQKQAESEPQSIDVLMGVLYSSRRLQYLDYGIPHCIINHSIVSTKEKNYQNLEALKGKEIVVQNRDGMHEYLLESKLTDKIILVNTINEGLDLIASGKYDAALFGEIQATYYVQSKGYNKQINVQRIDIDPIKYSMAVTNKDTDLLYLLNTAMYQLKLNGIYDKIYNKWFGVYEQKGLSDTLKWIFIISEIAIIILLIFIFTLRVRVNKTTKELREKNDKYADLIEKMKIEIETCREIEKKLLYGELKYRTIINSTNDAIFVCDAQTGIITDCNDSAWQLFDFQSKKYFLEENVHILKGKEISLQDKIEEVNEKEKVIFEWQAIKNDGTIFWTQVSLRACEIEKKPSIIAVLHNIEEKKKNEQKIIEAKEKAIQNNQLKSVFLANMSHEIRTPLNAIVGFSEMLSTTESKEEKKDFQEIISRNCSLLLQLINDILDLSKIESGTLTMQFSKFTISSVCLQVLSTIQFKVDKSIVELKSELNFDCILESDRNKVTQVISNFLTNAIKFTPNGSITIRTDEVEGRKLEVSVIDTGIGIPEDKQKIVFERFIKLNTFVQGTGLGLPICKIIMDNLGGEIGVDSEIGVGSRFWFRLPYAEKIQVVEKTDSTEPEVKEDEIDEKKITIQEKLTSHAKRCKVLAAEDDDNNYQLLYFLLKKHFDITRANNGKEAVDLFNDVKPDIVLMDIKMPVMDGFEATQLIRKIDKQIPIIAITAYAYDSDINKAIKAGCNDFITKPIKIDLLLKKLMQC